MLDMDVMAPAARNGGYKVDVSRGERVGRVSSEWFSRPDDERYLSLAELFASVKRRSDHSRTRTVESAAIRVEASRDDPERLALLLPESALFAHIVSQSVNAVQEPWNRRPRALAHADQLAQSVGLDMAALGWKPTVDGFLGRVTKARLREAVTEARGAAAADRIAHLKKGEMAAEAETLLADSGWLPSILRTRGKTDASAHEVEAENCATEPAGEESAAKDGEPAMDADEASAEDMADELPHAQAAE